MHSVLLPCHLHYCLLMGPLSVRRHGFGILQEPTGVVYTGKFVENKKHGVGSEKMPDGATYDGPFTENKRVSVPHVLIACLGPFMLSPSLDFHVTLSYVPTSP